MYLPFPKIFEYKVVNIRIVSIGRFLGDHSFIWSANKIQGVNIINILELQNFSKEISESNTHK